MVAHQTLLSMEFSRQEYWVAISSSRGSSQPRIKPTSLLSLALSEFFTCSLSGGFYTISATWKAPILISSLLCHESTLDDSNTSFKVQLSIAFSSTRGWSRCSFSLVTKAFFYCLLELLVYSCRLLPGHHSLGSYSKCDLQTRLSVSIVCMLPGEAVSEAPPKSHQISTSVGGGQPCTRLGANRRAASHKKPLKALVS